MVLFSVQEDQLITLEAKTSSLLNQLETMRREKHEVEEARAKGAKQRDIKVICISFATYYFYVI